MKKLLLFFALSVTVMSASADKGESIREEYQRRIEREWAAQSRESKQQQIRKAKKWAEDLTGARAIRHEYETEMGKTWEGGLTENIWIKMSDGQICVAVIDGDGFHRPECTNSKSEWWSP